jgi:hypothetical protein
MSGADGFISSNSKRSNITSEQTSLARTPAASILQYQDDRPSEIVASLLLGHQGLGLYLRDQRKIHINRILM